jgi:hypothetical protein
MLSASVVAMTWAGVAAADSPNLKGAYGFTGTAACLVAPGQVPSTTTGDPNPSPGMLLPHAGFQPDLRPNDAIPGLSTVAFSFSNAVEGIRTFNGDGTGTVKGTSVGITVRPTPGPTGFPHFPPSAGSAVFSYNFHYTVNGDGSWIATMDPNSYHEEFVTGPRSHFNPANGGVNQTVDAIPPVTGLISQDGKTLILVADKVDTPAQYSSAYGFTPQVETVTFSNGDVHPQICHRSRVLISLGNGRGGKDD